MIPKRFSDITRPESLKPTIVKKSSQPLNSTAKPTRRLWLGTSKKSISQLADKKGPGFMAFVLAGAAILIFVSYAAVKTAKLSFGYVSDRFQEAVKHLNDFEFGKAKDSFSAANDTIKSFSFLEKASDTFTTLGLFGERAVNLGTDLVDLNGNAFSWLVNQQGDKLIAKIDNLKNNFQQLALLGDRLQGQVASFNYKFDSRYFDLTANLYGKQSTLEALSGWLKLAPVRHFLVLFQNASEIRPGGGFIGSYADVTLKGGNLAGIDVRDVYDPDGQLTAKIVPPHPLQAITARWGARDANWFFDFPASASKVIEFLENSKIYRERGVEFGGALAINIEIIRDFLAITGPVRLGEYNLELNSQNVLAILQEEVEAGEDKKAGQPKRILSVLTPVLFEKIGNLDEKQKQLLAASLARRVENKDLMVYFKDLAVESYLKDAGVGGEIAVLPDGYAGNYLAVVNANIGGHKTDAFIEQAIEIHSAIGIDGEVTTSVAVKRKHTGQDRKEWWYNAPNKNYIQIFAPAGSRLVGADGVVSRQISAPVNYKKLGYAVDDIVAAIESTLRNLKPLEAEEYELADKSVFASWFTIPAGEEKTANWKYKLGRTMEVKDGAVYEFIFDKQSGVNGQLDVWLEAPTGYIWRENGAQVYRHTSANAPRRLDLKLTLKANFY